MLKTGQGAVVVPKLETVTCKTCGTQFPEIFAACPNCGAVSSTTH